MPKAIRLYEHGASDRLKWEEGPVGLPGPGEILIRQTAVGVDYIDVYVRTGLYPRALPTGLGFEAAGVVTALGPRVRGFRVGERVGYSLECAWRVRRAARAGRPAMRSSCRGTFPTSRPRRYCSRA